MSGRSATAARCKSQRFAAHQCRMRSLVAGCPVVDVPLQLDVASAQLVADLRPGRRRECCAAVSGLWRQRPVGGPMLAQVGDVGVDHLPWQGSL
eukprot:4263574-Pyramimonas_sp.AAC.1